jgi:hypothetical protein
MNQINHKMSEEFLNFFKLCFISYIITIIITYGFMKYNNIELILSYNNPNTHKNIIYPLEN